MAVEAVWGLDIGQNALKAVKAVLSGGLVEVLAFDHIEYREPATSGGDNTTAVREALQTFLSRNDVENCDFSVSIAAGRSALIRFIKLPPVDRKKVPDIVRYEATQQIPFPLEDVIWDYQVIERQYAPGEELEVGIFAMRREAIFSFLSNLMVSGIEVGNIQLAAAAVYNCIHFDQLVEEGAVMGIDIGAENTNLVIVDGNNVWTRSLPIGGNDFTRAIATKYGLEFEQAETLKRSMQQSKKAAEIFEALRPSLRSLLDEIQRSAGYYRSLHRGSKFVKLLGFGSGFKMYGMQRYLEAGLAYPVEAFGRTNNVMVDSAINVQFFRKNAPAFGAALGLAVQALGFGGISTNLMPPQILKERMLKRKRPMLIAAAGMLAGAAVLYAVTAFTQPTKYNVGQDVRAREIKSVSSQFDNFQKQLNVRKAKNELMSLVGLMKSRTSSLEALNALTASIPEGEHPVMVETIAMDFGEQGWVNGLLKSRTASKSKDDTGPLLESEPVERVRFVTRGMRTPTSGAGTRATSGRPRRLTAEQRGQDLLRRLLERDQIAEDRRTRLRLMRERGETSTVDDAKAKAGAAKEKLQFAGVAFIAEITIETDDPRGVLSLAGICEEMKGYPGVIHCDYYWYETVAMWEHVKTHGRQSEEPAGGAASEYVKKDYTRAVIQWVYSPI